MDAGYPQRHLTPLALLAALNPELVLLAPAVASVFRTQTLSQSTERQVGVEAMDIGALCRTSTFSSAKDGRSLPQ